MTSFAQWKDRALWWAISAIIAGFVSWAGWLTVALWATPDTTEVRRMIAAETPYVEDRQLIMASLEQIYKTNDRLSGVIERNTDAINALRIELAKLQTQNHNPGDL